MSIPYRVVQAHPTTSQTSEGFLYPEECWACFLSHSKIFSGNRLGCRPARRWVLVTPRLLAYLGAQGVVEALPGPAVTPLAAIPVHTGPFRVCMREHAPFDAPVDDIKNGIDYRSHIECAVAPTRLRWWDHMFDTIPFGISKV